MTPVRLEPAALRSRVKHSTTEPLPSLGTAGVGVFVAEKRIEKVFEVKRVSDWIILVKIIVGHRVL